MASRLVEAINAVYDRFVDGAGAPTIPEPVQSDLEAILWNLAGADVDLPVADTELEGALTNPAEHADEIGGGGGNTITVTLVVEGEEGVRGQVSYAGFVGDDGYLCAAYNDGTGYLTDVSEPIHYAKGTSTAEFMLFSGKHFLAVGDGITSASGAAVYDTEMSEEWQESVYIVSGDCTLNITGSK